jgi:hypothetical protein
MTTSKEITIDLIFDPHGNELINYKHQKVNIIILGQGTKKLVVHLST